MLTTTFFGLSGQPVRKDEPEPEAAGGDEEVQENRANQVLRGKNIYSMIKCKAYSSAGHQPMWKSKGVRRRKRKHEGRKEKRVPSSWVKI